MDFKNLVPSEDATRGKWFKFDEESDVEFCIASAQTKEYRAALHKKINKLSQHNRQNAKVIDRLQIEVDAAHVLLDWNGDFTNGGEPFPSTLENRRALLDQAPELRAWVAAIAGDMDNYKAEAEEADKADLKSEA